ncbi:dienelactone hydrolase family protein [Marinicella litoralis]|uniref:Carboxymethylenebutenolidase n=1 Tax=Marinicella litoralis TaxID=644220 RepID=A0A4V3DIL6_9GAMM|nr:dienelactone hydrolase family protein [Marinicella litoralis]TDR22541.1 carboxymethylenebutenolidase [Marinicella litoralis]
MSKQENALEQLDPQVYQLFDQYVHSQISRRQFLQKVGKYAIAGLTAQGILALLAPNYAHAIQIPISDARVSVEMVQYESPKSNTQIIAQLSTPVNQEHRLPGVVVVHENRGLNPYIADVGRRASVEGFIAIAPDALSPLGGYPGNDDDGRTMQRKRDKNDMLHEFIAAYDYLYNHPQCNGCIGVVGFCFGGWVSNMMATRISGLKAAVPFYGTQPTAEEVATIQAPLLIQYGDDDERVNAGWPDYEKALKAHGKDYQVHFYPNSKHGFHNDSTPRFNPETAALAWQRTIDFFKKNLVHS